MGKDRNPAPTADHSPPGGRPPRGLDLAVALRRGDGPLHEQLEQALRDAVADGRLGAGTALPSTRTLAGDLGVSRGVVVEAYAQLRAEGVLRTRPGGGTDVAPPAAPPPVEAPAGPVRRPPPTPRIDLRSYVPELGAFPRRGWADAAATALREAPDGVLEGTDHQGTPALRAALAAYLGRARGVRTDADGLVVTSGTTQSIALLAEVLRDAGPVVVEGPGFPLHHELFRRAGIETIVVPVDRDGIDVGALPEGDVAAALVTPAHQFPLGGVLGPERRSALLAWAAARDALLIEDDYDGEYRYDRDAPPALQGGAPERVAYLGTASKTLAGATRLGWIAAPPGFRERLVAAKGWADGGTSVLVQLTMAELLTSGAYDRHVRRSRDRYRRRRDRLLRALDALLPEAEALGVAAGLHVTVRLPEPVDLTTLLQRAWTRGVALHGAVVGRTPGAAESLPDHPLAGPMLLVGFGNLPDPSVERAARELAELVAEARG
ncbi:MocR-like pyridoxine biosynthesis transcription factor PdxR [Patulibacter defluvii]|uniref:MocR-like pyridoxine biosynthesis transcription factor PdxR n=1 Tax=Patulibacter defluvii TaxID=3095358 RepID=UPI002A7592E9|nr:PLP-dependent aminotransferase family protein [Patulibacter sp. DM4]